MDHQGISVTKKRGRPAKAPTAVVRLPMEVIASAEEWAESLDKPSRPEAISRLVTIAIEGIPALVEMITYLDSLGDPESLAKAQLLRDMLERK